jgi:septum formation protein
VVALEGVIYEKPKDENDAVQMLKTLSGKKHNVYSGVCLMIEGRAIDGGDVCRTFHEATSVKFAELSDAVIRGYVATGEPMDKAGAYGIQAAGGSLVEGIQGDYFNVMGFPLHKFCKELVDWLGCY